MERCIKCIQNDYLINSTSHMVKPILSYLGDRNDNFEEMLKIHLTKVVEKEADMRMEEMRKSFVLNL